MYSSLARHFIYPIYELYKGRNDLGQLYKLDQTQWVSRDDLNKLQWMKIKKILESAYNNVPYYRKVFKDMKLTPKQINSFYDFKKLPLLDKEIIKNNFNDLKSSNYKKNDFINDSTGGSTGFKINFLYNKKNMEYRSVMELRGNRWAGLEIGEKSIKLWGSKSDISHGSSLNSKIYGLLFPQLVLSSYNLSKDNIKKYIQIILNYKPKTIIGYSSALYLLAKYIDENKINGLQCHSVISTAEVLFDHQRELIESTLNCKVFNRYGSREFSTIAQECEKHAGLHINAEHVFIEILDEEKKPCDIGKPGEIVVTDLDNDAFPFIRYRIGDIGILSHKKCSCGRGLPLFENINGRTWDVIIGVNGNRIIGSFWLIKNVKGIEQYQILQEDFGKITINIVINDNFSDSEKKEMLNRVYKYCGNNMKVNIQIVSNIPLTSSGKRRIIISKLSPFIT